MCTTAKWASRPQTSRPILFSPICCNWCLSQVKIISWQYLKLLLWQKIQFYNGIWLFKMYRRFQWNTNESKSISPCQICLMECQFSIATRRWTELLGPEVPVPPTVHCTKLFEVSPMRSGSRGRQSAPSVIILWRAAPGSGWQYSITLCATFCLRPHTKGLHSSKVHSRAVGPILERLRSAD